MDKLCNVINMLSTLTPDQMASVEAHIINVKQSSCKSNMPVISAEKNYALVQTVDSRTRVFAVGLKDECLKHVKNDKYTSVDPVTWVYNDKVVSIVEVENSDVSVAPNCAANVPTHIVVLLDKKEPKDMKTFNNKEAVDRYIRFLMKDAYKVVQL